MPKPCQHCHALVSLRPRQLCYRCYEDRSIRALYRPKTTNYAKRSRRDRRLPKKPTRALPGSEAKLRVFEQRFARRVQLFHPLDA
ncbi:MAG TPA: hypothetical protein PLN21_13415 [Gemmatales bacterium]|nr:hypothetical protein [Gemmatales bacterium]